MSDENNGFPFNSDDSDHEREAEELRLQIAKISKKLTGDDPEPATNVEILQFLRVINYNFISITRLLHAILLKTVEIDTTLVAVEANSVRLGTRLQQFFDTDSMLDEIMKEDSNVSGSAFGNMFTF